MAGFQWGAVSAVAMVAIQLGLTATMARLLDPASFGLMAMALVCLRLFTYLAQIGFGPALIQKAELNEHDINVALGITLIVGGVCTTAVVVLAPMLAHFFRNSALTDIVRVLAVNILLISLGTLSVALMRRAMRFRAIAFIETASYALGYGLVGIACAWAGWGVWALVAATLAQSALILVAAYAMTRHTLKPSLALHRSALVAYGARHSVISTVEFLSSNLDTAVVGRLLGDAALGVYNRAALLANLPVEKAATILTRVLFPVLSAVQNDRTQVGHAFMLALLMVGLLAGATAAGMGAAANSVVALLLGPKWTESVPVLQTLAWAVPCIYMSHVAGVVCDSQAFLRFKLQLQSGMLFLLVGLMVALYPLGVTGVCLAIVITEAVRLVIYLLYLCRKLDVLPTAALTVMAGVAMCAFFTGALVHLTHALLGATSPLPVRLGMEVLAGSVGLFAGVHASTFMLRNTAIAHLAASRTPKLARLVGWKV